LDPVDDPFRAIDQILGEIKRSTRIVFIEFHGEATSEKQAFSWYVAGRASAVVGTHTHVQTADEQILEGGTAYLTDAGMTGPYDSVLGRRIDRVLLTARTFLPTAFDVAEGDPRIAGAMVDCDPVTGKASSIRRVMMNDKQSISLIST